MRLFVEEKYKHKNYIHYSEDDSDSAIGSVSDPTGSSSGTELVLFSSTEITSFSSMTIGFLLFSLPVTGSSIELPDPELPPVSDVSSLSSQEPLVFTNSPFLIVIQYGLPVASSYITRS